MSDIENYPLYPRHESAIKKMEEPTVVSWSDLNELRVKAAKYELLNELGD